MKCSQCGDDFDLQEIAEWILSHEPFNLRPLVCPDCFDDLTRPDLEEQLDALIREEVVDMSAKE